MLVRLIYIPQVPTHLLEIELDFYGIGHREVNRTNDKPIEHITSVWDKGRLFFNEPGSSVVAKLWMLFDIFFIISSVLIFVLRTEQVLHILFLLKDPFSSLAY